ncbi:MAG: hypothetical protein H5T86_09720, partial [Armatimonadetes bacterium]|nr:hypothetical protein [Armatimonadota bacterium]
MRKLSCRQVKRIIGTGRPEDWDEELRGALREHVDSCETCRLELATMHALRRAIAAGRRLQLPAHFQTRLMQRIGQAKPERGFHPLRQMSWRPVAALAGLAVALLIVVLILHLRGEVPGTLPAQGAPDIATTPDAQFLQELVMYHQQLAVSELGHDPGLLLV